MRIIPGVIAVLALLAPSLASGQSVEIHGSAGPTLADSGVSGAAGVGLAVTSRVTLMVDVERIHLPSRVRGDEHGGISYFRGGTFTLVSPAIRVTLFPSDRIGPYGFAGFGAGISRRNVNDTFPTPMKTDVVSPFAGGGIHIPLSEHLALFADARLMLIIGTKADDLYGASPVRAGLTWRF